MKIKDLPIDLRPREKAIKFGFDSLSDIELIAIILINGTKDCNVIQLATNVLSVTGGLNGLLRSNYQSLKKIPGIKNAKALSLASLISIYQRVDNIEYGYYENSIEQILEKYQKRLIVDQQEKLILVILNRNKRIVKEIIIAMGNDCSLSFSLREIFKEIYLNNGYGFYLIHTHPNAISFPSRMDIKATEQLRIKAKRINIHFVDHYIVGRDGITSINDFLEKS